MSDELLSLGRRVAIEQDAWLEVSPPLDLRERVLEAAALRKPSRVVRRSVLALAAALSVAAAALFIVARGGLEAHALGRQLTSGDWLAAAGGKPVPLEFSDGSTLLFAPGTRGRLGEVSKHGAQVVVEAGRVEAHVVHHSGTDYRLSFGPFAVDVTGTRFDVDWDPTEELLTLTLREGSVLVSGCVLGTGRPVMAGETLRAWCRDRRFEVRASDHSGKSATVQGEPAPGGSAEPAEATPARGESLAASPALPGAMPSSVAPGPSWRELARDGQYGDAFAAASRRDFSAECQHASLADLGLLADVARFSKNPQSAILAYTSLRRRFPSSAKSAQAAFDIARLHFDQLGQYDEAARWFRTYLGEQPRGALAREALGRLIECDQRAGHAASAQSTAREYLTRYPTGPHARLAHRLLDER